jgi:hypothetical protein
MALQTYERPDPANPSRLCESPSEVVVQTMTGWGSTDEQIVSEVRRCTSPNCDGREGEPVNKPPR